VDLAAIAELSGVRSVVLADPSGTFLGAIREADGEAVAAVVGFLTCSLGQLGDELGLGPLLRMSVAGEARASLVVALPERTLSAAIEPAAAFPAVERAIEVMLQG
jgi:hypothetical protein